MPAGKGHCIDRDVRIWEIRAVDYGEDYLVVRVLFSSKGNLE